MKRAGGIVQLEAPGWGRATVKPLDLQALDLQFCRKRWTSLSRLGHLP
jgi:hypothetical protein